MKILLFVTATIAGLLFGGVSVSLVQLFSSFLYPAPPEVDVNQPEQVAAWIKTLPTPAFLIVLASWAAGPLVGTYVARRISPGRAVIPALIVWLLFGAATMSMLIVIPHPWWMWPAGLMIFFLFGLLGLALAAPRQCKLTITRTILAPTSKVFQTIAYPENYKVAIPDILKIEFLSSQKFGEGTRFRETRNMNGKEAVSEMTVVEHIEDQLVTFVSEMAGAAWDTRFTLRPQGSSVDLQLVMIAEAKNLLSRLIIPMLMGMVGRAVETDMDHVKANCER